MRPYAEYTKKLFNQTASTYDHKSIGSHARKLYPYMLEELIHMYGDKVLDLGCGTGEFMKEVLSEDNNRLLTGVDSAKNMLDVAKEKLKKQAAFVYADASTLPFENESFDIVYCNDSFHHYEEPAKVIQEVARVLKPGGIFLIGEGYLSYVGRGLMNLYFKVATTGDVKIYSKKEWMRLLDMYFEQCSWKRVFKTACIIKGVKRCK